MREIKFRAWDIREKTMYPILDLEEIYNGAKFIKNPYKLYDDMFNDIVIMQYTGLKDKNGQEIYEGDITIDKFNDMGIIKWEESWACFYCEPLKNKNEIQTLATINIQHEEYYNWEVIGNIYENSELLKKVKK